MNGLFDGVEVFAPHTLNRAHLIGPTILSVLEAVGERGNYKAAITSRGACPGFALFDDDDIALGVCLLGKESSPESGIPGANHYKVSALSADQGRVGLGLQRVRV